MVPGRTRKSDLGTHFLSWISCEVMVVNGSGCVTPVSGLMVMAMDEPEKAKVAYDAKGGKDPKDPERK